jgi:meso-butanediol dehydrogenase / (S,S)-butanediol dehydrogenase / diacetyl reductase
MMRLTEKVAIVTGAAAGIGRASTLLFASEGAKVAAVDLDDAGVQTLVQEVSTAGGEALAVRADVSKADEVRRVVHAVIERFGRVDILFNNVGIVPHGKIHTISEAEWDRTMTINVKSMYLLCREVIPVFLRQGGGVILNTSSATALRSVPDRVAYSTSKGAVLALTRSMAVDYVRDRIRVNCLCPGTVDTPSFRQRMAAFPDPEEALRQFVARQPMGRLGTADEVAQAALYLVSDEAQFVTGAAFSIDGGMAI